MKSSYLWGEQQHMTNIATYLLAHISFWGKAYIIFVSQGSMYLFMQNGQQKGVPYVDGLTIGTITRLLSVTGVTIFVVEFDFRI